MAGVGLRVGRTLLSGLMNSVSGPNQLSRYGACITTGQTFTPLATPIGAGCGGNGTSDPYVLPTIGYVERWPNTLWAAVWLPSASLQGTFVGLNQNPTADAGMHLGVGDSTMDNAGNNIICLLGGLLWRVPGAAIGTGAHTVAVVINVNAAYDFYIDGGFVGQVAAYVPSLSGRAVMNTMAETAGTRTLSGGAVVHAATWNRELTRSELVELHVRAMRGDMLLF